MFISIDGVPQFDTNSLAIKIKEYFESIYLKIKIIQGNEPNIQEKIAELQESEISVVVNGYMNFHIENEIRNSVEMPSFDTIIAPDVLFFISPNYDESEGWMPFSIMRNMSIKSKEIEVAFKKIYSLLCTNSMYNTHRIDLSGRTENDIFNTMKFQINRSTHSIEKYKENNTIINLHKCINLTDKMKHEYLGAIEDIRLFIHRINLTEKITIDLLFNRGNSGASVFSYTDKTQYQFSLSRRYEKKIMYDQIVSLFTCLIMRLRYNFYSTALHSLNFDIKVIIDPFTPRKKDTMYYYSKKIYEYIQLNYSKLFQDSDFDTKYYSIIINEFKFLYGSFELINSINEWSYRKLINNIENNIPPSQYEIETNFIVLYEQQIFNLHKKYDNESSKAYVNLLRKKNKKEGIYL